MPILSKMRWLLMEATVCRSAQHQVQLKQFRVKVQVILLRHSCPCCEDQHPRICVGKGLSEKIPQKERSVRLPHHHVTLILNYFLLLKDVQSFQISHLKSQLENCFVVVVEKSCHLSEVLSRTILHH